MSVGRRKGDPLDFYETPPDVTEHFLTAWRPRIRIDRILEPAVGAGAMVPPLHARFPSASIDVLDLELRFPNRIPFVDKVATVDFLKWKMEPGLRYDLVLTNPPFLHALEFAEQALRATRPGGYAVLLLRMNFIESAKRFRWLRAHMPEAVYFLKSRPRFYTSESGSSSDASGYGWFIWRNDPALLKAREAKWRVI